MNIHDLHFNEGYENIRLGNLIISIYSSNRPEVIKFLFSQYTAIDRNSKTVVVPAKTLTAYCVNGILYYNEHDLEEAVSKLQIKIASPAKEKRARPTMRGITGNVILRSVALSYFIKNVGGSVTAMQQLETEYRKGKITEEAKKVMIDRIMELERPDNTAKSILRCGMVKNR